MKKLAENSVYVVSVTKRGPAGDYDFSTVVFGAENEAVKWIESQMAQLVTSRKLDGDTNVDGWFVLLDGWNSTVQYSLEEKVVL